MNKMFDLQWKGTDIIVHKSINKKLGVRLFLFWKDKQGTLHGIGYYSLKDNKFYRLKD